MALFKVTHLFALERNGWSETWYVDAGSHESAYVKAENLALVRMKGLAPPAGLEYVRVSKEDIVGDALVRSFNPGVLQPDKDVQIQAADAAWTGWLTRLNAGFISRKMFIVRGLPDDWTRFLPEGLRAEPSAGLTKYFTALMSSILANQIGLRVLDDTIATRKVKQIEVSLPPATHYTLTLDAPHGFTEPTKVRGFKFARELGLGGVLTSHPEAGDANKLRVFPKKPLVTNHVYKGGAIIQEARFVFSAISSGQLLRFVSRKTGARFFVTRGRRAAG